MTEQCESCGDSGWVCEAHGRSALGRRSGSSYHGEPGDSWPPCNPCGARDDLPDLVRDADLRRCDGREPK